MNAKAIFLSVKETGHILAGLTGAADFAGDMNAEALAGDGLLVRYAGDSGAAGFDTAEFLVTADQLEVLPIDSEDSAVVGARNSYVKKDGDQKKIEPLNLVIDASIPNMPAQNKTQVVINAAVPNNTKVWIQLAGPDDDDRQVKTGIIQTNAATINVDPLKPSTHYFVLVLVGGLQIQTLEINTPA